MKKRLTACLCLLLCTAVCFGQLKKSRLGSGSKDHIGLNLGVNYPVTGLDKPMIGPSLDFSYTHYFIPRLGLRTELGYNWLDGHYTNGTLASAHALDLSVQAVCNYYVFQGGRSENNAFTAAPERAYIFAGVGALGYFTNTPETQAYPKEQMGATCTFPIGTGVQWASGDSWTFGIDFAYHFTLTNKLNAEADAKIKDGFPTLSFCMTYKFPDFDMPSMESYLAANPQRNKIESHTSARINRGKRINLEGSPTNRNLNRGNRTLSGGGTNRNLNRSNRTLSGGGTNRNLNRSNRTLSGAPSNRKLNKANLTIGGSANKNLNRGNRNKIAGIKTYKVNRGGRSRVDNRRAYSNRSYRHRPMNAKKLYKKGVKHMHCDPRKGCTFTFD